MVSPTNQSIETNRVQTAPHTDDPQLIRAQIERTRAQMGQTLDEIQVRLSPDYIKQQTQETIREATVEKVEKMAQTAEHTVNNWRANAVHTVKENPIPAALIGIGIGWLLLSDNNGRDEEYAERYDDRYYDRYGSPYTSAPGRGRVNYDGREREDETGALSEAQARAGEAVENAQEWVGETSGRAQQKVQDAAATVQHKASAASETVRENVGEVTSNAQHYVSETAEQARQRAEEVQRQAQQKAAEAQRQARRQMRRAKRSFWQTMEENPLAIGVAAAAAGALIGLALPSTEKENELMGETRDRLVEDASSTVQETMHKVQTVAEKTAKTAVAEAKEEADKQNMPTPALTQTIDGRTTPKSTAAR